MSKRIIFIVTTCIIANVFTIFGQKRAVRSVSTMQPIERTVLTITPEIETQQEHEKPLEAERVRQLEEQKEAQKKAAEEGIFDANTYYIAWLYKQHKLNDIDYNIWELFDKNVIKALADAYSLQKLSQKSVGYNKKLKRFIF